MTPFPGSATAGPATDGPATDGHAGSAAALSSAAILCAANAATAAIFSAACRGSLARAAGCPASTAICTRAGVGVRLAAARCPGRKCASATGRAGPTGPRYAIGRPDSPRNGRTPLADRWLRHAPPPRLTAPQRLKFDTGGRKEAIGRCALLRRVRSARRARRWPGAEAQTARRKIERDGKWRM